MYLYNLIPQRSHKLNAPSTYILVMYLGTYVYLGT